jgi:hypothetical protein
MQCDNTVAVSAMNMSRITNKTCQAIMREIAFITALHEVEIFTTHLEGFKNEIADALSRWHTGKRHERLFHHLTRDLTTQEVKLQQEIFKMTGDWV